MFKVKVYTIGRLKETWLSDALADYEKRLKGRMEIEWVLAKNDEELTQLVDKVPYIALDLKGKLLTSEKLAEKVQSARLNFVIGGAEGLPPEIVKNATWSWSLSKLTFTHQLVRLILVEQLYRALEIQRNSPYHK